MKRKPLKNPTAFVLYLRKSGDNGQAHSLDAQRAACEAYLAADPARVALATFTEIQSGADDSRPELAAALAFAAEHGARILVSKLDRLARSVLRIASIMASGVEFIAADQPTATKFSVHILSAVAEFERDMIVQRTKDGLAVAKSKGIVLGAEGLSRDGKRIGSMGNAVVRDRARERAQALMPAIEAARAEGHTTMKEIAAAIGSNHSAVWRALKYTANAA